MAAKKKQMDTGIVKTFLSLAKVIRALGLDVDILRPGDKRILKNCDSTLLTIQKGSQKVEVRGWGEFEHECNDLVPEVLVLIPDRRDTHNEVVAMRHDMKGRPIGAIKRTHEDVAHLVAVPITPLKESLFAMEELIKIAPIVKSLRDYKERVLPGTPGSRV